MKFYNGARPTEVNIDSDLKDDIAKIKKPYEFPSVIFDCLWKFSDYATIFWLSNFKSRIAVNAQDFFIALNRFGQMFGGQ